MAGRRSAFTQGDLTKLLKAFRDAGYPAPEIVIEAQRITARPVADLQRRHDPNPWDET